MQIGFLVLAATAMVGYVDSSSTSYAQLNADESEDGGGWTGSVCPRYNAGCTPGPVVQVTVTATGQSGDVLHYRWRATDGSVMDHDSPTTTWRLPPGPGLHFVYVLVSNHKGGYTERRALLSTDAIGSPLTMVPSGNSYKAPPAPAMTTGTLRSEVVGWYANSAPGYFTTFGYHDVLVPDARITINSTASPYVSQTVTTNVRGQFTISGIPIADWNTLNAVNGGANLPFSFAADQPPLSASSKYSGYYIGNFLATTGSYLNPGIGGTLALADGSPCGTVNEFFGVMSTGSATGSFANGMKSGPVRGNVYGDFNLPDPTGTGIANATLRCERGAPVQTSSAGGFGSFNVITFADSTPPVVSAVTVTLGGHVVGSIPPSTLPIPSASREHFLTRKGVDNRMSACLYYKAIGAYTGCDQSGNQTGAINFDDWKRATHMAPYLLEDAHEARAVFVNKMDLNLTRNHHSVSYGPNNTAAYVCNHLGPPFTPTQSDIDTAVANAVAGRNEVACVAMDYTATPGVNGGAPFVRFIIFGPNGEILPSINLDGIGEKFMPGACVACHGGSNYAGHFPTDGTGLPDLGSHFLPYDANNFLFASQPSLREMDEERQIKRLNLIVLKGTGPTTAEVNLINGWYAPNLSRATLNKDYIPPNWDAQPDPPMKTRTGAPFIEQPIHNAYRKIIAPMCRTCHVAMPELYNFDDHYNYPLGYFNDRLGSRQRVCGSSSMPDRAYSMPNSLVTFNRFWQTQGAASPDDLTELYLAFIDADQFNLFFGDYCPLNNP